MTNASHHENNLLPQTIGMREMQNFRANVERLIKERGWTMVELQRRSKVSRTQITLVLSGDREITVKRAAMIADAFGLPLSVMLREGAPSGTAADEVMLTELYRNSAPELKEALLKMAAASAHDAERTRSKAG
jgi:transcriptional regulator with XRE-family HTH domain